jgi:hypothetical protein
MQLPDFIDREFRRTPYSDNRPTALQSISPVNGPDIIENECGGGIYERTPTGAIRYVDSYDDYIREFPEWLRRGDENDCVDWETVAVYAAQKPRMAPALAEALILRFEDRIGRPAAIAAAHSAEKVHEIEAAWKWIDRNSESRLAPICRMAKAPRQLTAEDIVPFPMLAAGVSLRLDTHVQWDGSVLALARKGLTPSVDGTIPAYGLDAGSLEEAVQRLCNLAADLAGGGRRWTGCPSVGDVPGLFHVWPIEVSPMMGELVDVRHRIRRVDPQ